MGHDLHFLQRLERISLPHVELAMSLYQDPQLVGLLLDSANLPAGAEKIAVSLDDPVAGPFLILARSGRFVTCLGAGMTIDAELPLITRSRLDSLLSKVADYRSRVEQAHKLAGNRRVTGLLRRIYTAGDELSREEFVALSAWAPLMPREFLSEMLAAAEYLEKARRVLLPTLKRSAKGQEALLRSYWDTFWALGHLALLVGQNVHQGHDVIGELRQPVGVDRIGRGRSPVAALVCRDRSETGGSDRWELVAPRVRQLGEPVTEHNGGTGALFVNREVDRPKAGVGQLDSVWVGEPGNGWLHRLS